MRNTSLEPIRRVGKHRVDLARLRRRIALRHRAVGIVAADLGEQSLEFLDIAVDGLAERGVRLVASADFVERLLARRSVEPAPEHVPLAAPVTVPELDDGIMIKQSRNIERQRVDRIDGAVRRLTVCLLPRRRLLSLLARAARQELGEPAAMGAVLAALLVGVLAAILVLRRLTLLDPRNLRRTRRRRRTRPYLHVARGWFGKSGGFA